MSENAGARGTPTSASDRSYCLARHEYQSFLGPRNPGVRRWPMLIRAVSHFWLRSLLSSRMFACCRVPQGYQLGSSSQRTNRSTEACWLARSALASRVSASRSAQCAPPFLIPP